jgi:hypothetical protein
MANRLNACVCLCPRRVRGLAQSDPQKRRCPDGRSTAAFDPQAFIEATCRNESASFCAPAPELQQNSSAPQGLRAWMDLSADNMGFTDGTIRPDIDPYDRIASVS